VRGFRRGHGRSTGVRATGDGRRSGGHMRFGGDLVDSDQYERVVQRHVRRVAVHQQQPHLHQGVQHRTVADVRAPVQERHVAGARTEYVRRAF